MEKKRILVLTDHMPWGHRSIARAIFGYLSKNAKEFNVEYAEVKSKSGIANDGYTFLYRFMPAVNRIAVKLLSTKIANKIWHEVSEKNEKSMYELVKKKKPDVIISAYLVFSKALSDVRKKKKLNFKLWTVVADPWTIIPQSYIKEAECHLVYDQVALGEGLKRHILRKNILVTGWWTRVEMFDKYDRDKIKKKLGFDDDRPVIFVGGGSLGSNILAKILPSLMFVDKKVGFIFNTGTDKLALRLIKEYSIMLSRLRKKDMVRIKSFGWIDNMAEILSASDIVFGKAGPNFLFDVVAVKKPFVSITHLGGQEDGNIDLIKRKKLGWIAEKPAQLSKFLNAYLANPKRYETKYKKEIEREAEKNRKSGEIILTRLRKEVNR